MSEINKIVAAILSTGRFIDDFGVVRMHQRMAEYGSFLKLLDGGEEQSVSSTTDPQPMHVSASSSAPGTK